jgi:hypothetical protein
MLEGLFTVSKIVAEVDQGQRYAEPETKQRQHGGERHGTARVLAPDEEVQEEAGAEDDSRVQSGGLRVKVYVRQAKMLIKLLLYQKCSPLPFFSFHGLVNPSREVTSDKAHEDVAENCSGRKCSTRCRRQHAKHGKNCKT